MRPLPPRLLDWLSHWSSLRGERRVPLRAAFDPTAVPALLPHIHLLCWETPQRLVFRLNGTAEEQRLGRSLVGVDYLEVLQGAAAETIRQHLFEWSLWPSGVLIDADEVRADGRMHQTVALSLPLVSEGGGSFMMTVVEADPDPAFLPQWGDGAGWRDQIVGLTLLDLGQGLPASWRRAAPDGRLGRLRTDPAVAPAADRGRD